MIGYDLPKRDEIIKAKANLAQENPVKLLDIQSKVEIVEAKIDTTPIQEKSVNPSVKKVRTKSNNRRNSRKWTVAEDMVLISHYGRMEDELLMENLGRSLSGIQARYRTITKDKQYVGSLVLAGLESSNLNFSIKDDKVVIVKKPSRFKRWRLNRLERKVTKQQAKANKLNKKLRSLTQ